MLLGFGLFGLLAFLRGRFLRFPLHPIGYLVVLMTIFYNWVSPYHKEGGEASLVWGGVLIAWLLKKLIIKYGGMHSYKQAKPFFIGLVVGSVLALFAWNMTDLLYSMGGLNAEDPSELTKHFLDKAPYSPRFY
jgi:hypothetical protein